MKNNNRCSRLHICLFAIVGFFVSLQSHAIEYTITNLGSANDNGGSSASGINDNGQVVGIYGNSSGLIQNFIWQNNIRTDIGSPANAGAGGKRINNAGQVEAYLISRTPR